MKLSENQNDKFKYTFNITFNQKPENINEFWVKINTKKYLDMSSPKQFFSFFSPSTPTYLKSEFMITKIKDKRSEIEPKLKGLDGLSEGFWRLYGDKTFGMIFVNGFKVSLLNMVLKL